MTSIHQPEPDNREVDHDEEVLDLPRFMTALAAETEADHENHLRARVALINRFVVDPEVVELFARWAEGTRIGQAAYRAALCWERLDWVAIRMGFSSWADVEAKIGPDGVIFANVETDDGGAAIQRDLDESVDECNLTAAELESALAALSESREFDRLFEESVAFVRRWPRSWPWMSYELVLCWSDGIIEAISRTHRVHNFWLALLEEMPAATFETRPGESLVEAVARLFRETVAERPTLPPGRRAPLAVIDRYVECWYRHYIRGESINRIARDVTSGDRKLVRYGIDRAQHWLDVAIWVWRDEDAA